MYLLFTHKIPVIYPVLTMYRPVNYYVTHLSAKPKRKAELFMKRAEWKQRTRMMMRMIIILWACHLKPSSSSPVNCS